MLAWGRAVRHTVTDRLFYFFPGFYQIWAFHFKGFFTHRLILLRILAAGTILDCLCLRQFMVIIIRGRGKVHTLLMIVNLAYLKLMNAKMGKENHGVMIRKNGRINIIIKTAH